ncbi:MAG: hypothetical protein ABFC94_16000 [Syntrophomonas sp.]
MYKIINGIVYSPYMAGSYQSDHSLTNRSANQSDPNLSLPAAVNNNYQALPPEVSGIAAPVVSLPSDHVQIGNTINKNSSYDKLLKKIGASECHT